MHNKFPSSENTMNKQDVLDEIIENIDPSFIPHEFIVMAKITLNNGRECLATGEELNEAINDLRDSIHDIRVIYDIKKMKESIVSETEAIFSKIK